MLLPEYPETPKVVHLVWWSMLLESPALYAAVDGGVGDAVDAVVFVFDAAEYEDGKQCKSALYVELF